MSKFGNDDFLAKFANRVEKVGRDGVMGLMKSTGLPINIDRENNLYNQVDFNYNKGINSSKEIRKNIFDDNNSTFEPRIKNNIYINRNINKFPTKNYDIQSVKHYSFINNNNTGLFSSKANISSINGQIMNDFNKINNNKRNSLIQSMKISNNIYNQNINDNNENFINRSVVRKNSMNYRYNLPNNIIEQKTNISIPRRNIYTVANNRQNIVDHGYTPYTLKDYKKISNDVKLGKLGPNIGTEDWVKKKNRMQKMSELIKLYMKEKVVKIKYQNQPMKDIEDCKNIKP